MVVRCAVIDIYGWAGPCEAVVNRFAELKFEVNDDAALQFLMVWADALWPDPCWAHEHYTHYTAQAV